MAPRLTDYNPDVRFSKAISCEFPPEPVPGGFTRLGGRIEQGRKAVGEPKPNAMTEDRKNRRVERIQRLMQIGAILGLILMLSTILHKGMVDIAGLARIHSGSAFWQALGRYLFSNLAGG